MSELLTSEHLILRKAVPSDLNYIWKNVWSVDEIAGMMLWKTTKTLEDAKDRLNRTMKVQAATPTYFVCLKSTNEPIGFAGVLEDSPGVYADSGVCIASRYQNQGFGKEVLGMLISFVFRELHGKKMICGCFHHNHRSAAVIQSYGFHYAYSKEVTRDWDGQTFPTDFYELMNPYE